MVTWTSVHIHSYADPDLLVTQVVEPVLLEFAPRLDGFFFLRYWERGPHVRVRGGAPSAMDGRRLLDALRERSAAFFAAVGEAPDADHDMYRAAQVLFGFPEGEAKAPPGLLPHGTVQVAEYRPEYRKYGGRAGVEIAEEVFRQSSLCAFASVREQPLEARALECVPLMVATLSALGMDRAQTVRFLRAYADYWAKYVSHDRWKFWQERLGGAIGPSSDDLVEKAPNVRAAPWVESVTAAVRNLVGVGAQREVTPRPFARLGLPGAGEIEYVLLNYFHTHHNRLGLSAADESCLATLGGETLIREGRDDVSRGVRRAPPPGGSPSAS